MWSPRSDSNGHARGPRLLRPVRLPIPPRGDVLLVPDAGIEPACHAATAFEAAASAGSANRATRIGVRGRVRTDDRRVHIPERCRCATRTIPFIGLHGEVRTLDPMRPKHVRRRLRYAEMI